MLLADYLTAASLDELLGGRAWEEDGVIARSLAHSTAAATSVLHEVFSAIASKASKSG